MNPELSKLHPYPFQKLNTLKAGATPPSHLEHIALSIGEPKHAPPAFVLQNLTDNLNRIVHYPATKGIPELRESIAHWLSNRFNLPSNSLDPEHHILPVNGTREALFAFAQCIIDKGAVNPTVVMPNPFYQIYEGAAILAGAKPHFLNGQSHNNFIPDFDAVPESVWQHCQLIYLCSPGNPTGAVINAQEMKKLIALADKYDFIIASDECYSELYFDENTPPVGLLEVCHEIGRDDFKRCVVFHSLSKRSNLPGLRSGFVAGDSSIMKDFLLYRTYHGCALPVQTQLASAAAWQDEKHVIENRVLYKQKFTAVLDILKDALPVSLPDASFYLWPETPIDDTQFAQQLFAQQNVTVLPGSYLARNTENGNPGKNRIRMALVATLEECIEAANRLKTFCESIK